MISRGGTPLFLRIVRLFVMTAGKARTTRWRTAGATVFGPPRPRRFNREPGDLPCVPGEQPLSLRGESPAASTEVVMADKRIFAPLGARLKPSLIPVLVTGIQPARVRALKDSLKVRMKSIAPKDLGALDSCDEHRNEGVRGGRRWFSTAENVGFRFSVSLSGVGASQHAVNEAASR
jgi:hypothetical protein